MSNVIKIKYLKSNLQHIKRADHCPSDQSGSGSCRCYLQSRKGVTLGIRIIANHPYKGLRTLLSMHDPSPRAPTLEAKKRGKKKKKKKKGVGSRPDAGELRPGEGGGFCLHKETTVHLSMFKVAFPAALKSRAPASHGREQSTCPPQSACPAANFVAALRKGTRQQPAHVSPLRPTRASRPSPPPPDPPSAHPDRSFPGQRNAATNRRLGEDSTRLHPRTRRQLLKDDLTRLSLGMTQPPGSLGNVVCDAAVPVDRGGRKGRKRRFSLKRL